MNITDITDESGYIESIGKKAASEAINQAKIDVSDQDRKGSVGEAEQVRERTIKVAQNVAESETGKKQAEADKRIYVQQQETLATIGETEASRDMQIKVAENEAASAKGVVLYGGEFKASVFDAAIAGPVYRLPGGDLQVAAGVDLRKEEYKFQGDERDLANQRAIFNVPFDNVNALGGVERDIKAVYAEALFPVLRNLEFTAAVRRDDYTGFVLQ